MSNHKLAKGNNKMTIYDSVQKTKREFIPLEEGKVSLYVCGPTVYDDAHLGHAKSALVFDLLTRVLTANDLDVTYARNITDIDDKIIKKAIAQNKDIKEITDYYTAAFHTEMSAIGVSRPDIEPKATESLNAMFDMMQLLIDKGHAYTTKDGDVYFDTASDSEYLTLSGRVQDDEDRQERVASSTLKKNPADFAMWKSVKDDSLTYESPYGPGRPGWHLECSAMIEKHLAKPELAFGVDIHGGGADLLFPHHENEAAQSRCATGHELAKYWMHNGFVQIDGEKMSKSLGNSFFLKDALTLYDGEILRYYLNAVHYRNDFNFSEEELALNKKRLDKLYRLKKRVSPGKGSIVNKDFKQSLLDAMGDDLNISMALSHVDELIATTNDALDLDPKNKALKKETLANIDFINTLLGFGGKEPFSYFQIGVDATFKAQIEAMILERTEAKKEKDFTRSDDIRDALLGLGISIMDTADGTLWEKA